METVSQRQWLPGEFYFADEYGTVIISENRLKCLGYGFARNVFLQSIEGKQIGITPWSCAPLDWYSNAVTKLKRINNGKCLAPWSM